MSLMHILTLFLALALQPTTTGFTPDQLWHVWPDERFVTTPAPCLRQTDLMAELERLADLYPQTLKFEEIGTSYQGRPIAMMTLGHGPRPVLLWSQMHGDEPSATPALLDIAHFLLSRADTAEAAAILDDITLLMIPMLNPDGAEVYERRNFQGIDINRDALNRATPEGRLLKKIRDEYEPVLAFNLHDQGRRTAVGDTGVLATNAVLAVAGDAEGTLTPGRALAQRACSAIVEALAPFIPGGMARFDENWNPRAFGDNITAWGTPVVLIESGGLPPGRDLQELTRLNFVAILTVLQELARNDLADFDPEIYTSLLRNKREAWADVVVRGGLIQQPGSNSPYRADLAFNLHTDDRDAAGCSTEQSRGSRVVEIGDARFLGAGRVVDAERSLVVAPFTAGATGWKARRWLNAEVLSEVARLGVGTVIWNVPDSKVEAAHSIAHGLAGSDRARLAVVSGQAEMPRLVLVGPPRKPVSDSLADVIQALTGKQDVIESVNSVGLDLLTTISISSLGQPNFAPGRPASFLVLSPATGGKIDPGTIHLDAVFMNGVELKAVIQ